jgi:16S rRNA (adenine1518-N6/adenine1519-N6)-dimethyltransferase
MRARKRFAQHFLEPAWAAKLVAAIAPASTDRIVEIGPGRGALTMPLAGQVDRLVAVEIDRDLAAALQARALPNVEVVGGDVLTVDLTSIASRLAPGPVRVVGNLPYNISSPILLRLFDASASGLFRDATVMLQREVADRLIAKPGTSDYGVLTLTMALRADVTRLLALPPGAFRPAPKVHSAVVRLSFRPPPPFVKDHLAVVELVRAVFMQRRKTLANALAPLAATRGRRSIDALNAAGIDPMRRPETLTLEESARLSDALTDNGPAPFRNWREKL